MSETTNQSGSAFRAPSAWAPLMLAAIALAMLGGYLITGPHAPNIVVEHGVPREDEGVIAHLWQLLMLAQVVAIAVFLARWMPKAPRQAAAMLALQGLGLFAAALPVWLLEH
ncbi:MAG TPA: hypothetical protein VIC34_07115 [Croceibacterium sp.]|jgi:hypothetical protein